MSFSFDKLKYDFFSYIFCRYRKRDPISFSLTLFFWGVPQITPYLVQNDEDEDDGERHGDVSHHFQNHDRRR